MAIRVFKENLECTVGSLLASHVGVAEGTKMVFPFIEAVDSQGKMVSAVVRKHRFGTVSDNVQLLDAAEAEPGARKRKSRAGEGFQFQHVAIESATRSDVLHMDSDMVEFESFHVREDRNSAGFG